MALMRENPPMWLNYNNSAKMSEPQFLHRAVKAAQTLFHTTAQTVSWSPAVPPQLGGVDKATTTKNYYSSCRTRLGVS